MYRPPPLSLHIAHGLYVGVIRGVTNPCTFTVSMVRNVDGKVLHYGKYDQGQEVLQAGEEVLMDVDEGRRRINARLHSAGHLIDAAVSRAGYVLKPTKGKEGCFDKLDR